MKNPALIYDVGAELAVADGGVVEVTAGADGPQVLLDVSRLRRHSAKVAVIFDGTLSAGQSATVHALEIQTADGEGTVWESYKSATYDAGSVELTISADEPRGILGLNVELGGAGERVRLVANVSLSAADTDTAGLSVLWVLGPES